MGCWRCRAAVSRRLSMPGFTPVVPLDVCFQRYPGVSARRADRSTSIRAPHATVNARQLLLATGTWA